MEKSKQSVSFTLRFIFKVWLLLVHWQKLTFYKLHHLDVIRMCNKGPVNLEDSNGTMMRIKKQILIVYNLPF